jgi:hypothetical protein
MAIKRNKCNSSGCEQYRFKAGLCLMHHKLEHPEEYQIKKSDKPLKQTPLKRKLVSIKKVSDKQKERLEKYFLLRDQYFLEHPICEFPGCNSKEIDLHHKSLRIGESLYENFMSCCRYHHNYIHSHPQESYEKGWLIKTKY